MPKDLITINKVDVSPLLKEMVEYAKENKELLVLTRELIIWEV